MTHQQEETREQEPEGEENTETVLQQEGEQLQQPSNEQHRLIAVGHRDIAADDPT